MWLNAILAEARDRHARFTILGGTGFIGTHLAEFLQRHGLPFDVPPRDDPTILTRPLGHVIYAIGLTSDYECRPFDTVEAHVGVLAQVLAHAQLEALVYLSSTRLYDSGDGSGREDAALPLTPTNPRHIYDLSKGLGEALCVNTRRKARVARLSSVYAEDLSGKNFLHEMVRSSVAGQCAIETAPDLARDYIDIEDVCGLLVTIAVGGKRPIYNVASGENVSNKEVLQQISALVGVSVTASKPATFSVAPEIDITCAVEDFGYIPRKLKERLPALVTHAIAKNSS